MMDDNSKRNAHKGGAKGDFPMAMREGEKIVAKGEISLGIFWKPFSVFCIAMLFSLVAMPLCYFLTIVASIYFIFILILKSLLLLVVTNQRVFFRSGMIKVDTVQVRIEQIESVEIQRTLTGMFFNYGTVVLTGTGSRFSYIPYLANAPHVRDVIDEMLYQREKRAVPDQPTA